MKKTICIHGHFYQPPRENPWLEYIEVQPSAYPYHDWNERITAECYLPNYASRLVNNENKIVDIVNNYSKISLNFGPTVLHWMKKHQHDAYWAIIKSDQKSVREKNPAAIAQCYNHMIMPLANDQDKLTQIIWGIKDFEYHFKRKPLGMWLPETAVDIKTLEALAKEKIKFTILAEHQVKEIKKITETNFVKPQANLSFNSPYLCKLPSGKSILIFVFNGEISYKISFTQLLSNGIDFAKTLLSKFNDTDKYQLVSIATDGETFGHHKKFGDMALASCIRFLQMQKINICSYSKYFEENTVSNELRINENTSWSCAHGIGRWKEDCSCNTGRFPKGNQKWRKFLREALDFIRDELKPRFENIINSYEANPWDLRNDYIAIIHDRSKKNINNFFQIHFKQNLSDNDKTTILTALEIQRNLMLMYTSCGWFFDDISGIETIQIMQYAKRALQLSNDQELEKEFLQLLQKAQSNDDELKNGKIIYEKYVNPSCLSIENVLSHYTIAMLFEEYSQNSHFLCYEFSIKDFDKKAIESNVLLKGKIAITSLITYETKELYFISVFLYPFTVFSYVENLDNESEYQSFLQKAKNLFSSNKISELNQLFLENKKNKNIYSFWDMFTDEKNKIFDKLLNNLFVTYKNVMKQELENQLQIFSEIKSQNIMLPEMLNRSLDLYFHFEIFDMMKKEDFYSSKYSNILEKVKQWNIDFDTDYIKLEAEKKLKELFSTWIKSPLNIHIMEKIERFLIIFIQDINIKASLWHSQNMFFSIRTEHKDIIDKIEYTSNIPHKWIELMNKIANLLSFKLD